MGRRQSAPPNPVAVAAAAAATAAKNRRATTGLAGVAEGRPGRPSTAGQAEGRPAGLAGSRTASELPGVTGQPTRTASELVAMGRKRPPPPPPGGPKPPPNGVSPRRAGKPLSPGRAAAAAAGAGLTFGAGSHDGSPNGRRPLQDASRVEDLPLTRGAAKDWLAASVDLAERSLTSPNPDMDDDGWSPNSRANPRKAADDEARKAAEAAELTKVKAGEKEMLTQMRKSVALASLEEQQSRGGLTSAFFARRRRNSQETITIPSAKDRRSLFSF